ncbi:hypothetical protein [Romboutsia ilealis]|uniref:hypothetical protein n=2 Tax=Bacillota TaxID=1239 RepID=UPI0025709986|nr:hypothetical protein [Romboutsia ilealis]
MSMKLKENFIKQNSNTLLSDWGHDISLKHEYKSENSSKVKSYKLNKKELDQYLKTGVLPKMVDVK